MVKLVLYRRIHANIGRYVLLAFTYMGISFIPLGLSVLMDALLLFWSHQLALVMVGLLFIYLLMVYFNSLLVLNEKVAFQNELIESGVAHLYQVPQEAIEAEYDQLSYADKMTSQSETLANFYYSILPTTLCQGLTLLGIVILLFIESGPLTIGLGIVLGLYFLLSFWIGQVLPELQRVCIAKQSDMFAKTAYYLDNVEQIKYHALFKHVIAKLGEIGEEMTNAFMKVVDCRLVISYGLTVIQYFFIGCFILFSTAPISHVLYLIALLNLLFSAIQSVRQYFNDRVQAKVSSEVFEWKETKLNKTEVLSEINEILVTDFCSSFQQAQKLNCHFKTGHLYWLIGENGTGKSTFLKILLGLDGRYQGDVSINGYDLRQINFLSMYQSSVFYLDQHCEWLSYVDVKGDLINQSRGERQQKLLEEIGDPKHALICLDEPSASLDVEAKEKLKEKIIAWTKDNVVLVVSHDEALLTLDGEKVVFEKC